MDEGWFRRPTPSPAPPSGSKPTTVAANPGDVTLDRLQLRAEANDGVVNAARIDAGGTYAGLVIADHADVIGSYQRYDGFGHLIEPGLLTSGARFEDEQFSQLLGIVAKGILFVDAIRCRKFVDAPLARSSEQSVTFPPPTRARRTRATFSMMPSARGASRGAPV